MIVTFPHMGSMAIPITALLEGLGIDVIPPPPITKKTLDYGVKYAPETACLPLKTSLGNFIEAIELGADTIITCGGVGPCRLGYYAEVHKGILRDLGIDHQMIVVEPTLMDVLHILRTVAPRKSWGEILRAFRLAGAKMNAVDAIERKTLSVRPREKTTGMTDEIKRRALDAVREAQSLPAIAEVKAAYLEHLENIPVHADFRPLSIGIVGEIYVMLEAFVNQDLFRRLGRMGVEVHASMLLSDYVRTHLLRNSEYCKLEQEIIALAKPYLGCSVGGHGIKSIGWTVYMSQKNVDGIIHLLPFTCMPEIIAKSILPQVSRDCGIPVLSLTFDEQSGEAGIVTRLEAFIDLLGYRRRRRNGKEKLTDVKPDTGGSGLSV